MGKRLTYLNIKYLQSRPFARHIEDFFLPMIRAIQEILKHGMVFGQMMPNLFCFSIRKYSIDFLEIHKNVGYFCSLTQ